MKNILFICILLGLLLLSADEPMSLVFALGIACVLFRKPLLVLATKWQSSWYFVVFGIVFGMYTEVCALLGNMHKPLSERILLDPHPMMDLVFGFFFYGLFVLSWYGILRQRAFSSWHVFLISGCIGVLTEQFNPAAGGPVILLGVFFNPLIGIPMALLIAGVYGIFPTIAYFFTKHTFGLRKQVSKMDMVFAMGVLLFQWAIFGNFLLPLLKRLFLN